MEFFAELGMAALAVVPLVIAPSGSSRKKGLNLQDLPMAGSKNPIDKAFIEASTFLVNTRGLKLDAETKLALYGYYKVAISGPCNAEAPSVLDMLARAKWESWMSASSLSQEEAKKRYIELATQKVPQWRSGSASISSSTSVTSQTTDTASASELRDDQSSQQAFGVSVSKPSFKNEVVKEDDQDIFYHVKENNYHEVRTLIAQLKNINVLDSNGEGLLHHACDRNHIRIVELLLDLGADINLETLEYETPLQYAVTCEHLEVIELLLRRGARVDLLHEDTIKSAPASIQALFQKYSNSPEFSSTTPAVTTSGGWSPSFEEIPHQRRPSDSSWQSANISVTPPVELDADILSAGNDGDNMDEDDVIEELFEAAIGPQPK